MSKIIRIFLNLFFIDEHQFRSTFFVIDIFLIITLKLKITLLLKWCLIFDNLSLHQFSKFNNFLCVCWFLCKNLSTFVSLDLKLQKRCCHSMHSWNFWILIFDFSLLDQPVMNLAYKSQLKMIATLHTLLISMTTLLSKILPCYQFLRLFYQLWIKALTTTQLPL